MALTSKEKSKALRSRRAAMGQKEIRNIWATDEEEKIIKPMVRSKLSEIRGDSPKEEK
jgi:hypothetical protein